MLDLQIVKQLREQTGAGMNDCQKALVEANGDMAQAVEVLRKKGLEKAGKKAERITKEGLIALVKAGNKLGVVGLACETDFVSRNQDFIAAVNEMSEKLMTLGVEAFKTWADEKIKNELIVKIGENMKLSVCDIVEGEVIGSYLHSNKKIASVVVLQGGSQELANDLAMQVAAMSPKYLRPEDVPAEELAKEKEIYQEQMKGENKPAAVLEKIIEGKLSKYYTENCLVKQQFIKDDKLTVEQLLGDAKVVSFKRYQI